MKTRRERFETIAANRVQKVLDSINTLTKCSNKNNYEYYEEDVDKMMLSIKQKIRELEENYRKGFKNNDKKFRF